jgi:membrane-bound serine protease (ClpP class)
MAFLATILAAFAPLLSGSRPAEQGLTVVRIDGPLDVGTQSLLRRAIEGAHQRGDRLVLDLDTPGGEIELMWQLANALLDAADGGLPTVAWVHDRALSAGSLVALACERVYMRSHATIGSALPVQIGPGGLMPASEDDQVREKLSSALRGEFRGVAEKRGRPGLLAEAMVDPEVEVVEVRRAGELVLLSALELDDLRQNPDADFEFVRTVVAQGELLNLTGSEAVELGLADGLAENRDELGAKLGLRSPPVTDVERSRSEELASILHVLSPLLLIGGFVLFYLELKAPGFGLPGILALVCFGLLLFGRYLVGLADVPHVVLLIVGAGLLATELFVLPGTIWLGLAGGLAILFGLVWSFVGSRVGFEYGLDRVIVFEETTRVVGAGAIALGLIWGLSRVLPRTPVLSSMVLVTEGSAAAAAMPEASDAHARIARVGAPGRVRTPLRPVGRVTLDADSTLDFEARSEGGEIAAGARVRVVEVQPSGRLVVAPLDAGGEGQA